MKTREGNSRSLAARFPAFLLVDLVLELDEFRGKVPLYVSYLSQGLQLCVPQTYEGLLRERVDIVRLAL